MPLVTGAYDGRSENVENRSVLDKKGRAMLISDMEGLGTPNAMMSSVDSEPARVRMHGEVIDGNKHYTDMTFDSLNQARLAWGLWDEYGPFSEPEGDAIPVDVAIGGQEAIAAYLRTNGGYPQSRGYVADKMGVQENTVSNYCNRVRWEPAISKVEDRVSNKIQSMNGEFTKDEIKSKLDIPDDIKSKVDAPDDVPDDIIDGKLSLLEFVDFAEPVDEDGERWRLIE
jgi:hypothetical protein